MVARRLWIPLLVAAAALAAAAPAPPRKDDGAARAQELDIVGMLYAMNADGTGQAEYYGSNSYWPNAWGLHDLHGNAWEWTRSAYAPYPYRAGDGRNGTSRPAARVVRGGSWYDRPTRCRSALRLIYPQYQRVYNVGFRVVCEVDTKAALRETRPE